MISKANEPAGRALQQLLNRATRRSTTMSAERRASPAIAQGNNAIPIADPSPCNSPTAALDFAVLRDGHLPPDGVDRLARHVMQCESCRLLTTMLVCDVLQVEATGEHVPAAPQDAPAK